MWMLIWWTNDIMVNVQLCDRVNNICIMIYGMDTMILCDIIMWYNNNGYNENSGNNNVSISEYVII